MRRKGRPSLADVEELDRSIIEAAIDVFFEHGPDATMQAVAKAAGVTRKTLYARYLNKDELFRTALYAAVDSISGKDLGSVIDIEFEGELEEQLQQYFEWALGVIAKPFSRNAVAMLTADMGANPDLAQQLHEAGRNMFFKPLKAILSDAVRSGQAEIEDIDMTAWTILFLLNSQTADEIMRSASKEEQGMPAFIRFLIQFLVHGLKGRVEARS